MTTTKMEAIIFQVGRHYTKFSHSSVSNIYLSICQEEIQRVTWPDKLLIKNKRWVNIAQRVLHGVTLFRHYPQTLQLSVMLMQTATSKPHASDWTWSQIPITSSNIYRYYDWLQSRNMPHVPRTTAVWYKFSFSPLPTTQASLAASKECLVLQSACSISSYSDRR